MGWPQGWPYLLVFVGWIGFALLIDHVAVHGWPVSLGRRAGDKTKWPHVIVMWALFAFLVIWIILRRFEVLAISPAWTWLGFVFIEVGFFLETATVVFNRTNAPTRPSI